MASITPDRKPIVIVGAGLTGCCTALLLARRFKNEQFIIIEGRDDYRKDLAKLEEISLKQQSQMMSNSNEEKASNTFGQFDNAASRSINLALSYRGICGLKKAGLWQEVQRRKLLILMKGRYVHLANNTTSIQPYSKTHAGIYSVSRLTLNCMFLDALAEIPNVDLRFMNKLVKINKNGILTITDTSPNSKDSSYQLESKFILGCDGAYSATRNALQRLGRYNFGIEYIPHGYKELTIFPKIQRLKKTKKTNTTSKTSKSSLHKTPSGASMSSHNNSNNSNNSNSNNTNHSSSVESPPVEVTISEDSEEKSNDSSDIEYRAAFAMEPNYLHIWPRDSHMMIGLPNPDKTFTCTLFAPWDGEKGLSYLDNASKEEIVSYFNENFPDFVKLCPNFYDFWIKNPASPLAHIHLNPWNFGNKILLLGDAAHAIVPFYGQGMNSGFEDAVILDELFDKYLKNEGSKKTMDLIEKVFNEFSELRQPSCEALSLLSLQNYVEMRSLTGKKWFLYKKKLEGMLNYIAPSIWRPIYSMVSFSRTPYHEALERADKQDRYLGIGLGLLTSVTAVGGYLLANKYYKENGKRWPWTPKRSNM